MSPPTSTAPSDTSWNVSPTPVDAAPGDKSETTLKAITKKDVYLWGPKMAPTGSGGFSAILQPAHGRMTVTVKCRFNFKPGGRTVFVPDPDTGGKTTRAEMDYNTPWPDGEPERWKAKFFAQASEFWSDAFVFRCTKEGFEWLHAIVRVNFVEASPGDNNTVVESDVYYGDHPNLTSSCGGEDRSCVGGLNATLHRDIVDDMAARHEAGHMIGLGDEYAESGKPSEAKHSALVEQEFGHKVIRGTCDPESIMNDSHHGTKVLRDHGVVLLYVLRDMTKEEQLTWAHPPLTNLLPDP
jgi:hypothetical protein